MRMRGELRHRVIAAHPRDVLFRRHQDETFAVGLLAQSTALPRCV